MKMMGKNIFSSNKDYSYNLYNSYMHLEVQLCCSFLYIFTNEVNRPMDISLALLDIIGHFYEYFICVLLYI